MSLETAEMEILMTDEQVSRVLKVPQSTLATWRSTGRVQGLPFVRVGGAIRYRRADVENFIQANLHQAGGANVVIRELPGAPK